jgi:hypothetical protein
MVSIILFNDFSAWWILPCILVGLLYAFILYYKSEKITLSYILFSLRAICITIICFLLLSPLWQSKNKRIEKPLIIIAQDQSTSIKIAESETFNSTTFHQNLKQLAEKLQENYEVEILGFGDQVKQGFNFNYTAQQTNISELFNYIKDQYIGRNIGAIVLTSDGIINKGSVSFNEMSVSKTPIYSIALGDTIPKKDLLIANVNYNKIVYLGNDYTLDVDLKAFASNSNKSKLNVSTNDGQVVSSDIIIDKEDWYQTKKIKIEARKKGIQQIKINVSGIDGEISTLNNQEVIYVEVLDGRHQVLLLGASPHPDLGAIKRSIENNTDYEIKLALADAIPNDFLKYDLIILHNLPSVQFPIKNLLQQSASKAKLFVVGTQTDFNSLNQVQPYLKIASNGTFQNIYTSLNKEFSSFTLSENTKIYLQQLPPLLAPNGNYVARADAQYLLSQKSNITNPSLVFFKQDNVQTAFLIGEGLWRWSMDNYLKFDNHDATDELLSRTVQYLNVKDDKRKFRVQAISNRFMTNESVILNAELYNDSYQLINDVEISLDVKGSNGEKFSFVFSKRDNFYVLDAGKLPEGIYSYTAKTKFGGKDLIAEGRFIVEKGNIELANTLADHQFLYQLSHLTGGKMLNPQELKKIEDLLVENEKVKTLSYLDKNYIDLINLKWIFIMIMSFLSLEWFLRKRNGTI